MTLLDKFENSLDQTVKTFNSIFKKTPIKGHNSDEEVVIGELGKDNKRKVSVGKEIFYLDLTQKEGFIKEEKRITFKRPKGLLGKSSKISRKLPDLYKMLRPAEFMIYSAIKEVGEIDGIEELSRQISLSNKAIISNLPRLISLGLIKKQYVACEGRAGSFNKLMLDLDAKNIIQ